MVFCDWFSCVVPVYSGDAINGGNIVWLTADGSIDREIDQRYMVEGSFSDRVSVRAWAGRFELSGNPIKFLQGHNIIGSADILATLRRFFLSALDRLSAVGYFFDKLSLVRAWDSGLVDVTRLDLTSMYDVGTTQIEVEQWISGLGLYVKKDRQEEEYRKKTFYIGRTSRRLSVKIYNKHAEFKVHPPKFMDAGLYRSCLGWLKNKVRIEVTVRKQWLLEHGIINIDGHLVPQKLSESNIELARGLKGVSLNCLKNLSDDILQGVYMYLVKTKVKLPENVHYKRDNHLLLPRAPRACYLSWLSGADLHHLYKRTSLYNYRKIIFETLGVDIRNEPPTLDQSTTVPLVRILDAKPASAPDWMYEHRLIA
jgi:II/X family phage/plasmid replication protein